MSRNPTYNKLVRVAIATPDTSWRREELIIAICREFGWNREQFIQRVRDVEAETWCFSCDRPKTDCACEVAV